jgi:hypothetical protein
MEVNGLTASLTLPRLSGASPTVWSVVVTTEDQKASVSGTILACSR